MQREQQTLAASGEGKDRRRFGLGPSSDGYEWGCGGTGKHVRDISKQMIGCCKGRRSVWQVGGLSETLRDEKEITGVTQKEASGIE